MQRRRGTSQPELGDRLYGFDAANGTLYWSVPLVGIGSMSAPALYNSLVHITAGNGVYAYTQSGSLVWSNSGSAAATTPVAIGGAVFYGAQNGVVRRISYDGSDNWTSAAYSAAADSVAVVNGKVFAKFGFTLRVLDAASGALLWVASDSGVPVNAISAPAIAYGKVYVATYNGQIRVFDENSGFQLWATAAGSPQGLSVANGVLFSANPGFRAFNANTGGQLVQFSGYQFPEPSVADGVVYLYDSYLLRAYAP